LPNFEFSARGKAPHKAVLRVISVPEALAQKSVGKNEQKSWWVESSRDSAMEADARLYPYPHYVAWLAPDWGWHSAFG
jgi:hypothetical protein